MHFHLRFCCTDKDEDGVPLLFDRINDERRIFRLRVSAPMKQIDEAKPEAIATNRLLFEIDNTDNGCYFGCNVYISLLLYRGTYTVRDLIKAFSRRRKASNAIVELVCVNVALSLSPYVFATSHEKKKKQN